MVRATPAAAASATSGIVTVEPVVLGAGSDRPRDPGYRGGDLHTPEAASADGGRQPWCQQRVLSTVACHGSGLFSARQKWDTFGDHDASQLHVDR